LTVDLLQSTSGHEVEHACRDDHHRVFLGGLGRAATNLARGAAFLVILLTLVLARSGAPLYTVLLALGVAAVALLVLERTRTGFALFVAYLSGFVLFALLRNTADETGVGVKGQYVVDAERRLFGGTLPTKWLQDLLYDPGKVGVVAVVCTIVYVSYYFAAHAVALAFWRRNRTEFKRYVLALLLAVYTGLAVSFVMPTAPPWLASEYTDAPSMTRVVSGVLGWNPEQAGAETAGSNPVAAMPSLHFALTVLVVLALWRRRKLRAGAALYLVAMGFTLVYGGEHYVIDVLVGAVVAVTAWLVATRVVGSPSPLQRVD
jgi:membrane-associated phospholipid phosphatase